MTYSERQPSQASGNQGIKLTPKPAGKPPALPPCADKTQDQVQEIACFNGGLFETTTALPLNQTQLAMPRETAATNSSNRST